MSSLSSRGDDWPRTRRAMPWSIAIFLVMVYWVPFDSITLPISLPINSDLDRFVLGGLVLVWLIAAHRDPGSVRFRHAPLNLAIFVFIVIAAASLVVNLRQLAWDGDLLAAIKQLSTIFSYLAAYLVVATTVRPSEIAAFGRLLVVLGTGTALGTIYEYASGVNPFFEIAQSVFIGAHVTSAAAGMTALQGPGIRPTITGPALHGLADATLICSVIPFCLCFASISRRRWEKLVWYVALVTLLSGCFATGRKTALVVAAASFVVLCLYDPKAYLRFALAPVVAALALLLAAPGALNALTSQVLDASSSTSTAGRTSDYAAVIPDVVSHLLLGRGYGSFDPSKYRILDNQMLGWLVEVGVLGALAYAAMILSAAVTVHSVARKAREPAEKLMQAVVAASIGYLITNFLYDTFGFRQAPYTFFVIAALGVAYCGHPSTSSRLAEKDVKLLTGVGRAEGDYDLGIASGVARAQTERT